MKILFFLPADGAVRHQDDAAFYERGLKVNISLLSLNEINVLM